MVKRPEIERKEQRGSGSGWSGWGSGAAASIRSGSCLVWVRGAHDEKCALAVAIDRVAYACG